MIFVVSPPAVSLKRSFLQTVFFEAVKLAFSYTSEIALVYLWIGHAGEFGSVTVKLTLYTPGPGNEKDGSVAVEDPNPAKSHK